MTLSRPIGNCLKPQARLRTSSRNPVLRRLFVGVALILRNVWVWLHAKVLAEPRRGTRQLRLGSLRFARLLLWLMMEALITASATFGH